VTPVIKVLAMTCACLALTGCGQWQSYKCVRDMVNRNEPYQTPQDRDDSEALARQTCRERAAAKGN
jgi:hypothetical protein